MCGAEPLVSLNSAESVKAFYKLLGEREQLPVPRPLTSISPILEATPTVQFIRGQPMSMPVTILGEFTQYIK